MIMIMHDYLYVSISPVCRRFPILFSLIYRSEHRGDSDFCMRSRAKCFVSDIMPKEKRNCDQYIGTIRGMR
jgi:hypothetical protein